MLWDYGSYTKILDMYQLSDQNRQSIVSVWCKLPENNTQLSLTRLCLFLGFVTNAERTGCKELELDYIGRNLKSPWALVPFSFSIFGLLSTFIVLMVFLIYHKTPIIMAAGRELCYFILLGVALCYCFTFVVLTKPSEVSRM